ncbi:hypothetical protein B0H10DRAFT_1966999 [Mycena sp. CBHHK59/15]|nr:hypothetical protein B0H10DRAFT_1966999 [Mycena sp. CBHHK59/15]
MSPHSYNKSHHSSRRKKSIVIHCKLTCSKLLTRRAQQNDYSQVSTLSILPSESEYSEPDHDMEVDASPMDTMQNAPHPDAPAFIPEECTISPPEDGLLDHLRNDIEQESTNPSCSEHEDNINSDFEEDSELDKWSTFDEQIDKDTPMSFEDMMKELEDMLGPDEEAKLWDSRNEIITENDRDDIHAFLLKMLSNMPWIVFDQMRYAFRHKLDISLHWVMIH